MLTAVDMEIVGYDAEGDAYCPACAVAKFNTVCTARCDVGLSDELNPLSRYCVWEGDRERTYGDAQAYLARWPAVTVESVGLARYDRLVRKIARRMDSREQCVECGEPLLPDADLGFS